MTVYGPRCSVHPDRTGATRATLNLRLIVVHTSEGSEGSSSAENVCSFMTLPGDRLNPDGTRYGASYHYVTDTDRVLPAVPDDVVAYSAAGANFDGVHICIPGKAAQTRDQWLEPVSRAYIGQLSDVMVDVAGRHDIPLQRLTVQQVIDGDPGYCGHVDITNAYHRSDHTDPGVNFPWDVLAVDLGQPMPAPIPPLPEGLPVTFLWRPKGYGNVFLIDCGGAVHCSPELYSAATVALIPMIPDPGGHKQMLKSVLALSGIDAGDLIPA